LQCLNTWITSSNAVTVNSYSKGSTQYPRIPTEYLANQSNINICSSFIYRWCEYKLTATFNESTLTYWSRVTQFSIATGYGLDDKCSVPGCGRDFCFSTWCPPSQGYRSSVLTWPGREADHNSQSSIEVKNAWIYNSTPAYTILIVCLMKHRKAFTLQSRPLQTAVIMKLSSILYCYFFLSFSCLTISTFPCHCTCCAFPG
jgi:hypothetical protein